jgi:hypothetical protein
VRLHIPFRELGQLSDLTDRAFILLKRATFPPPSPSRKLGTAGQKLGGSAALCHIRHDPTEPGGCFTLTAANVGKCRAVLCRDGAPMALSVLHNVGLEKEYLRIRQHNAIVTEVTGRHHPIPRSPPRVDVKNRYSSRVGIGLIHVNNFWN